MSTITEIKDDIHVENKPKESTSGFSQAMISIKNSPLIKKLSSFLNRFFPKNIKVSNVLKAVVSAGITCAIIVGFPLFYEVNYDIFMKDIREQQIDALKGKGYTPQQIHSLY
ncbi:hypothetical protein WA158_001720 [Blastocystis sp. Blastoise]